MEGIFTNFTSSTTSARLSGVKYFTGLRNGALIPITTNSLKAPMFICQIGPAYSTGFKDIDTFAFGFMLDIQNGARYALTGLAGGGHENSWIEVQGDLLKLNTGRQNQALIFFLI